jgi:hypothetical protein
VVIRGRDNYEITGELNFSKVRKKIVVFITVIYQVKRGNFGCL